MTNKAKSPSTLYSQNTTSQSQSGQNKAVKRSRGVTFKAGLIADCEIESYAGPLLQMDQVSKGFLGLIKNTHFQPDVSHSNIYIYRYYKCLNIKNDICTYLFCMCRFVIRVKCSLIYCSANTSSHCMQKFMVHLMIKVNHQFCFCLLTFLFI